MHKKSLLPAAWKVPDVFRERLGDSPGRQRAMVHEGELLVVLHEPPTPDQEERQGRFFWRKPDGTWASTTAAPGHTALDKHLEEYDGLLDQLDEEEDTAQSADDYFELMRQLNPLVRAIRNLHAVLQQAREKIPGDKRIINYRDQAYTLERRAELLTSDAKNALDYAIARRAEEQAASSRQMAVASHRLNLLAAFFLPIATLTAIFGMNLRHGLEGQTSVSLAPFAAVLGTGLLAGILLMSFITRRGK